MDHRFYSLSYNENLFNCVRYTNTYNHPLPNFQQIEKMIHYIVFFN